MEYSLTCAAQRVLVRAADCGERHDGAALEPAALLLGLLQEEECRGALFLRRAQITRESVLDRWPWLSGSEAVCLPPEAEATWGEASSWSEAIPRLLGPIAQHLADYPQPAQVATEHLLWGLAASSNEVGMWLRQQGLDPDAMGAEIDALYHHRPGPLDPATDRPWSVAAAKDTWARQPESLPGESAADRPDEQMSVLRILDAAGNRAREALRVIEDFVRFGMDDAHLTECCKRLRHALTAALSRVPQSQLLAARETQADVGTTLTVPSERQRPSDEQLLGANFGRLQEALRSLEEFGKRLDPALGGQMEQVRYQVYTLQRAVVLGHRAAQRMAQARLYVLVDGRASAAEFGRLVETLVARGVHVLQLRDKQLDDRVLLARGRQLRALTRGTPTLFVMNDRPDLAVLAEADGVHVGQEELTVKDARTIVGPDRLVGVSTHSIEQARQAVLDGADYIGVGPTFASGTKRFEHFPGLELVRAVAGEIRLPAFAIGGIDLDNLSQVLETGIGRVAVSGAVAAAADPAEAVSALLAQLNRAQT